MPMPVVQEEYKQSDMPAIQAQAPMVHPPADDNVMMGQAQAPMTGMMDNTVMQYGAGNDDED